MPSTASTGSPPEVVWLEPSDADIALLWSASSITPDIPTIAAAAKDANLAHVLETAARHRVIGLVIQNLTAAGVHDLGPRGDWATSYARGLEARGRIALPLAAATALDPLNAAGLQPLGMKGIAILERYPSPGFRPMDDIDLLLPRDLADRALPVLRNAGWRRVPHPTRDLHYDYALKHADVPGVVLELHYDVGSWAERAPGLAKQLWSLREQTTVFGRAAWGLPPHAEIVAAVAHAAREFHLFNRIIWSVDMAILTRSATVDWDEVMRLATAVRRRGATTIALTLARRVGANVPDELLTFPRFLEATHALGDLLDPARSFRSTWKPRWVGYLVVDGVASKARFIAGDLLRPAGDATRRSVVLDLAQSVAPWTRAVLRTGFSGRRPAR